MRALKVDYLVHVSVIYKLSDLGQIMQPLCELVF